MSLITRCPACRTMFKVVPDQLRISNGWVRCGKCDEIFDASAQLVQADTQPGVPAANDSPDTVPFEGEAAVTAAFEPAAPGRAPGADARKSAPAPLTPGGVDFELKESQQAGQFPVLEPAVPSSRPLPEGSASGAALAAGAAPTAIAPETAHAPAPDAEKLAAELSFMRKAKRGARWHRPVVRAFLMVACLLLVLTLGVQMLVQERDRVAAIEPGLRPLVEEVCLLLECRVEPLRQIESVVIDSSAFSKAKGDVYRLSLTLKNNAPIDLAMPAVELSLTDTMDRALVRRVFLPEELGFRSGVIPAAAETQTTLVLTIKTNGNSERVAGYRLLAFYP